MTFTVRAYDFRGSRSLGVPSDGPLGSARSTGSCASITTFACWLTAGRNCCACHRLRRPNPNRAGYLAHHGRWFAVWIPLAEPMAPRSSGTYLPPPTSGAGGWSPDVRAVRRASPSDTLSGRIGTGGKVAQHLPARPETIPRSGRRATCLWPGSHSFSSISRRADP